MNLLVLACTDVTSHATLIEAPNPSACQLLFGFEQAVRPIAHTVNPDQPQLVEFKLPLCGTLVALFPQFLSLLVP